MGRFDGMIVIVTGAARGQGRAIAVRFAQEGADLAICDLSSGAAGGTAYALGGTEDLDRTAEELKALGARVLARACDVRRTEDVQNFVSTVIGELGVPGVLVNNAGIIPGMNRAHEISDEEYDNVLAVNLGGVFRMSRAVVPHMISRGGGRIVNNASTAGLTGVPMFAMYSASKHAVLGLTKAMAGELAGDGVTVNAVCPGIVNTPMFEKNTEVVADQTGVSVDDIRGAALETHKIKEFVTAEQIAGAVLFLADPEQSTTTGVALPIDAGWTA